MCSAAVKIRHRHLLRHLHHRRLLRPLRQLCSRRPAPVCRRCHLVRAILHRRRHQAPVHRLQQVRLPLPHPRRLHLPRHRLLHRRQILRHPRLLQIIRIFRRRRRLCRHHLRHLLRWLHTITRRIPILSQRRRAATSCRPLLLRHLSRLPNRLTMPQLRPKSVIRHTQSYSL